jgi:acyl carrier protein
MTTDLKRRIHAVVAATFGLPLSSISEATSSTTVESWDSMNHIHLMVALEAEFGVSFDPEHAVELTSIRAIEQALVALDAR